MLGVGTDILKIAHISSKGIDPADSFTRRIYTSAEMAEAAKREVPLNYYATRFAGKEAVFKALNISGESIRLSEIEILNDEKGQPHVTLSGRMAELAAGQGIQRVLISLSYDTDYAVAFAVSTCDAICWR